MKKKKDLVYITNALLTLRDAQSVQISSMSAAFHGILKDGFMLVTPSISVDSEWEYWRKIDCFFQKSPIRYYEFSIRIMGFLLFSRPKHVFTRDIAIAFFAAALFIPVVYEFHKESKSWMHEVIYRLFRKRIKVVAISEALGEFLTRAYKTPREQMLVAHDGVFVGRYDDLRSMSRNEIRRDLGLPEDKIIILHSGHLYKGRGAEYFGVIAHKFPDIMVLSVGGADSDLSEWKREYDVLPNIAFVPHQDQHKLRRYQMCADVCLYPMTENTDTYWCCSPLKVFEYMATGRPIIGVNIGSVGEILNESNAIIFDHEHVDDLCEKVVWYLENLDQANLKGKVALQEVRDKYTWEKRAQRIIDFIGV